MAAVASVTRRVRWQGVRGDGRLVACRASATQPARPHGGAQQAEIGGFRLSGPARPDAELQLVRDRGRVEVLVDGRTVLGMRDDVVGAPVDIGLVAVGGRTTCDFDDVVVRS
jgi:hypothetical protein